MTNETQTTGRSLAQLDKEIGTARNRLTDLEAERRRECFRGIDRVLLARQQGVRDLGDDLGFELIHRLNLLIPVAQEELARLESERAEMLLAKLDRND